jgi:UDP-N-acetylmuramoylalanine--D-glutamate ligase
MYDQRALNGVSVTVLGAGLSGISIASLARRLGADVLVSDVSRVDASVSESLSAKGIMLEQGGHTDKALDAGVVVVGSGFPPHAPVLSRLASRGVSPVGELDFVLPYIKGRIIGITGSNGKTTTTSLLGHLLNSSGCRCAVAGNIGNPIADFAGEEYDCVALELSSFQLHWAKSARLEGAVVTNLAPDHIDWHGSYENYAAAKAKILDFVAPGGFGIMQGRDSGALRAERPGIKKLSWNLSGAGVISLSSAERAAEMDGEELFRFDDTNLIGAHNMENAAMALAAVRLLGFDTEAARKSLASYTPPPHRCKLVLETGGVRYIDDSKGTNIAASVAAMSSIEGPHIVILGGRGKGEDYSGLVEPLRMYAKRALLIGEAAGEIAGAFDKSGYTNYHMAGDLESAVKIAAADARPGDSVLLSPACTSWDAYKNYHERGEHFASAVMKLAGGGS